MLCAQNTCSSYLKFISCEILGSEVSKYKPTKSSFYKMSTETSHNSEKRKGYRMQFKQDVRYANVNSNHSAATRFKVDVKRVREWKKQIEKLMATNPKKQKLAGRGRKLTDVDLEESLLAWIYDRHSNALLVSRKIIMFKVKSIYDEMNSEFRSSKTSCICCK